MLKEEGALPDDEQVSMCLCAVSLVSCAAAHRADLITFNVYCAY